MDRTAPVPGPSREPAPDAAEPRHFIAALVERDLAAGVDGGRVLTRFPPEPNGYLHIGHAKSIALNFGLAQRYGGHCNLRFDDTNPTKENVEFVEAIQRDIRWLGFDWGERLFFASDYFETLYELARQLVRKGLAYVCDLPLEEVRAYRGTLTEPGRPSPYRERPVAENLELLARMRAGEFPDGARTLRAKIDMASPNMVLRDPVLYRILHAHHHRTGDAWCLYPTYDWAHGQSDAIEGITHSLCTLEFENHRPLYDWCLEHLDLGHLPGLGSARPRQIEFARLALTHTVTSKRKLLQLVQEGLVEGWDDPRMPTLAGLRRRGYTPEALRSFCEDIGVTRANSLLDIGVLENHLREDLNRRAPRRMGVLRPLKLVIENYPADRREELEAVNNPEDPAAGTRRVPFGRELYIERDDFREDPPKKYFRLSPGQEVRLRYAYYVTCTGVVKDPVSGEVLELRCTYDPATRGGDSPDGRKVKGTIHWVAAGDSLPAEVRLYEHLFPASLADVTPADAPEDWDWKSTLNPNSLEVLSDARVEPALAGDTTGGVVQLERLGYFCLDPLLSRPDRLVLGRTVSLRDSWAKIEAKQGGPA